ncbi:MAG: large subunit ribosomal protein [Actinomycetota bacterium]|jgi:large subunit ribosomal protein L9|nr:large subunit ribosomal protein [Actinomycetota bacterium]
MKLILKQEVAGLGGPGDIIEVKDGYGRNYLVPQGLATVANRGAEKEAALIRKGRDVRGIRDRAGADEVAGQLKALGVTLTARAGAEGRLFGSITTSDVADAVKAAGGPSLDKRRIELTSPIKTVGSHRVSVRLHPELVATLDVEVVAG